MKLDKYRVRPAGEGFVWFTSIGLVAGIIMILFLLGLILWNGIEVFWPKRVVEIHLKEGSNAGIQGKLRFAGAITKERQKLSHPTRRKSEEIDQGSGREVQLFTGNKDCYGFMYKYIDADEIEKKTFPQDIVVAERMGYGSAIFYPLSLSLKDGRVLKASEPGFIDTLKNLIHESNERRRQYTKLERSDIGKINNQMDRIRIEKRTLIRKYGEEAKTIPQMAELEKKETALQEAYEVLAAKARELRQAQTDTLLTYRFPTGEEKSQPLGDITYAYRPNAMRVFDKIAFFLLHFWNFLSENPREANTEGGIFPAIFGTFVMAVLMSAAVMPFGVVAAIYLREYARQGHFVRSVRIAINNLAGVPSIVYGVFGLGFFVYWVGGTIDSLLYADRLPTPTFGTGGILWASLTLALMTVPVVVVATEEALAAVPRGMREASLACGASKWQTIQRIVLPASAPGILTGLILAMARGAGEVAPLMLVGVVKLAPSLPIDTTPPFIHMDRKFMHLGFHIYDLGFQSPDSEAAKPMVFATTFLLIMLVVLMNVGAIMIRDHLRKKYASSTF